MSIDKVRIIIMLLLILSFGTVINIFIPTIINLLLFIFVSYGVIKFNKKIKINHLYFSLFTSILILLHAFITHTNVTLYINLIIKVFFSLFCISIYDYNTACIRDSLIKVLRYIAVYSLIHYVIIIIIPNSLFVPTTTSDGGYYVRTIGYILNLSANSNIIGGINVIRNPSLFWEPGVLQTVMNILLYLELFWCNSSFKRIILPLIVIFTTVSTTGYALAFILLICKNISFIMKSTKKMILFLIIILISFPILTYEISKKVDLNTSGTDSFGLRVYDIIMPLLVASDNLFGIGYDDNKLVDSFSKYNVNLFGTNIYIERASSNSITSGCAYWGFLLMFFAFLVFYNQNIFPRKKLFLFMWLVLLSSEPLLYYYFSFLIFSIGLYNISNKYRIIR